MRLAAWVVVAGSIDAPSAFVRAVSVDQLRNDASAPVGTAVLQGRVIDGVTGAPVRSGRVRLQGPVTRPSVLSDAAGGFAFTRLPAGNYQVTAEKSSYLLATHPERGRTVRALTRFIELTDGQVKTVKVPIYRGGAITGRVVDAGGDPVEGATVSAVRAPAIRHDGRLWPVNSARTNDLGEFRVYGLEHGRYLLQATSRPPQPDEPGADPWNVPPQALPTFHPGTLSLDQAQVIRIERGETASGVDVMLVEDAHTLLTGTVVGADRQPVATGGSVSARRITRGGVSGYDSSGTSAIRPDGSFRLLLAPGDYRIDASQYRPAARAPGSPPLLGVQHLGSLRVSVAGASLDVGVIKVGAGGTMSGRIVFDGASAPPEQAPDYLSVFGGDGIECRSSQVQIDVEWRFRIEGMHGSCLANREIGLAPWTLKAMVHDGTNLLDSRMEFDSDRHLGDVDLVLTDRRSELVFRVSDDRALTTREYVALVFSSDKSQWDDPSRLVRIYAPPVDVLLVTAAGPLATRVPTIAPPAPRDVMSSTPGNYLVVAVDDITYDETRELGVLERLSTWATRLTIAEGATVEARLRRLRLADVLK